MRRVSWVRIEVSPGGVTCDVVGVGHRFPATRRVSLTTAGALAADGVPTVVRSSSGVRHHPVGG